MSASALRDEMAGLQTACKRLTADTFADGRNFADPGLVAVVAPTDLLPYDYPGASEEPICAREEPQCFWTPRVG